MGTCIREEAHRKKAGLTQNKGYRDEIGIVVAVNDQFFKVPFLMLV